MRKKLKKEKPIHAAHWFANGEATTVRIICGVKKGILDLRNPNVTCKRCIRSMVNYKQTDNGVLPGQMHFDEMKVQDVSL